VSSRRRLTAFGLTAALAFGTGGALAGPVGPAVAAEVASSVPTTRPLSSTATSAAPKPATSAAPKPTTTTTTSVAPTTTPAPSTVSSSPVTAGTVTDTVHHSPWARIFGLAALLIALILYSEGFGVLGGRIRSLSSRPARRRESNRG